jgi:archaellum component FlaC
MEKQILDLIAKMNKRLDLIEDRVERTEERLERINEGLKRVEETVSKVESNSNKIFYKKSRVRIPEIMSSLFDKEIHRDNKEAIKMLERMQKKRGWFFR